MAAGYDAKQFLSQDRQKIAAEMEARFGARVEKHHAKLVAFQLRQVYLPAKFEQGIMEILEMVQEQTVARLRASFLCVPAVRIKGPC